MTAAEFRPSRFLQRVDRAADLAVRRAVRAGRTRRPAPAVEAAVPVYVAEIRREAPDAVALRLAPRGGRPLRPWWPGAHVDVTLPSGRARQYSLCGDPADRSSYLIAVRRIDDGLGGSREMHELRVGDPLDVAGPRNAFPLSGAPSYLFLAGGIGITPMVAMIGAAQARGVPWQLVHTGRDLASLPFSGALAERHPGRVRQRSDAEHGGPPTAAELLDGLDARTAVYCCGPPPMIDAVRAAVPATSEFHAERFSPPPVRGGRPFTLQLGEGGAVVDVPADRSALEAVLATHPGVAYSCRQGFCGACHVPLLGGRTVGDTAGPGRMALCVGRAEGEGVVVGLDGAARAVIRSLP